MRPNSSSEAAKAPSAILSAFQTRSLEPSSYIMTPRTNSANSMNPKVTRPIANLNRATLGISYCTMKNRPEDEGEQHKRQFSYRLTKVVGWHENFETFVAQNAAIEECEAEVENARRMMKSEKKTCPRIQISRWSSRRISSRACLFTVRAFPCF
jgi:hypothetical protein